MQDLIRVLFGLEKNEQAKQWRKEGLELFGQLLNAADKSYEQKLQLQAKFSGFSQMRVDVLIEDGELISALEAAERNKNFFLIWILDAHNQHILSPKYSQIQQLIANSDTPSEQAIIYWHLSNFSLTTFIITHNADLPYVIPTQKPDRLITWIQNWQQQYHNFIKGKKQELSSSTWRDNLSQMLKELGEILNIGDIIQSIQNLNSGMKHLILIPHRDLHRFPLHTLFPDDFTTTYLPSAQIGLTLTSHNSYPNTAQSANVLVVEADGEGREHEGLQRLTYAEIEATVIAQIFHNTNAKYIPTSQANKTTIQQAFTTGYNIFHFTGHGSYNDQHPQNSALYLSYDSNSTEEKVNPDLTLSEIQELALHGYSLVCLSACETALTGNQTIETEYVGLVSAFLYQKGVSCVISSLWRINEISTTLLMIYFYRQIQKGLTPNLALAKATKWLKNLTYKRLDKLFQLSFNQLRRDDSLRIVLQTYLESIQNHPLKIFAHPYYWSGFTITGMYDS